MERTKSSDAAKKAQKKPDNPDVIRLGELEDRVGFHLRLAQNASFKAFKRHAGDSDLRPGWFAVLSLIDSNPGITPMALSRASGRDKSTITPVVRDLLRANLISRKPVKTDKRSYALFLTPAGEEKRAYLSDCAREHDRELDEIVGDGKDLLVQLLRRIITTLD